MSEVYERALNASGTRTEGTFAFALGSLAVAFVIYVTAKGELPTYLGFFLAPGAAPAASGGK